MLQFVGFEVLAPQIIYGPIRMDDSQRKAVLAAYAERLSNITNETAFDVGIY
jgi:NAD(P)H dehydrogenase (quinone)